MPEKLFQALAEKEWQTGVASSGVAPAPNLMGKVASFSSLPVPLTEGTGDHEMGTCPRYSEHPEPCLRWEKAKETQVHELVLQVFIWHPLCAHGPAVTDLTVQIAL